MKKIMALTRRNLLEMLRDPLAILFCLAFPIVMLLFMQIVALNLPVVPDNFKIENYAVGICVFGYTFTGMFLAMSIAGDKNTSFIKRISVSPVKQGTYLASFLCSGLPVAFFQTLVFFLLAIPFGFPVDGRLIASIFLLLPSALFYLSFGILLGVLCKNEKQTGPINSIVVSLTGMLGGVFMPVNTFTGGFKAFIDALPFTHTVQIASNLYVADAAVIWHLLFVIAYTALLWGIVLLLGKIRKR